MGLRSSPGEYEPPVDRLTTYQSPLDNLGGAAGLLDAQPALENLLRTKSDAELAVMFPSIKAAQWAAFRELLKIPGP